MRNEIFKNKIIEVTEDFGTTILKGDKVKVLKSISTTQVIVLNLRTNKQHHMPKHRLSA